MGTHLGASDEYPQHMFSWKNKKKNIFAFLKKNKKKKNNNNTLTTPDHPCFPIVFLTITFLFTK